MRKRRRSRRASFEFLDAICRDQIAKFGLRPGVTALEIGCGKGEFITKLCELSGRDGIGLDPGLSPGAQSKQRLPAG